MQDDIIIGKHSIYEALKNPLRRQRFIFCTKEGLSELLDEYQDLKPIKETFNISILEKKKFDQEWDFTLKNGQHQYLKCPSEIFLQAEPIEGVDVGWIYDQIKYNNKMKILCLDSLTDVHNGAAIIRTAAFYGVDAVVTASKGVFSLSPHFFRISSGGIEHLKLIRTSSLPSFLQKLTDFDVLCLGLTDKAEPFDQSLKSKNSVCLVIGSEDKGISNAVWRVLLHKVALEGPGPLKTLNASVAAALAMERYL